MVDSSGATRSLSHQDYLEMLHVPDAIDSRRISETQVLREDEINRRYHTQSKEQLEAATRIQKAYRGHRDRRQLDGLTLDPSSRWQEAIREWRYRNATAALKAPETEKSNQRRKSSSDHARSNWRCVVQVAQQASAGDGSHASDHDSDRLHAAMHESMLLDARYWLEMVDAKHRYGTNLLMYHEEWQRAQVNQNFFYWLDHGDGRHLSLPLCDRARLDKERIRYLSKEERKDYQVQIDETGKLRWVKNGELISTNNERFRDSVRGIVPKDSDADVKVEEDPAQDPVVESREPESDANQVAHDSEDSDSIEATHSEHVNDVVGKKLDKHDRRPQKHFHVSPATVLNHLLRASVKPGTWIYVADTVGRLYVGIKSSGAFQHASFLSGARISSAGLIGIEDGLLTYLSPLSGHYRPTTKSFRLFVESLKSQGVDLSRVRVSSAYKVLLATEYYGRTRAGIGKVVHRGRKDDGKHRSSSTAGLTGQVLLNATGVVDQHWQKEHKHGLAKLMDDLHIKRKSMDESHDQS